MEWKEVRLCEVADVQTGPFGSQLHKENYVNKGTPIVTVEHLGNKWFTSQNLPMVSDEDKLRLAKYCSQEGDVIFSRVGSVDRCSYVSKEYSGWLFSGRCLRVRPRSGINPEYLYYFLTNEGTKQYIRNIAVGATMPSINTKLLNEVPITIPSLDDQRRIASILSSLDRKIELNNKINADLEEMAQAIFKNWFVDFEPFKDGKFVDSELGMIPEGWKVGKITDIGCLITDYVSNGSFASLKQNVHLYETKEYAQFIRNTDLKTNTFSVYVDKHSYDFLSKSTLYGNEIIISNVGDVGSVHLCPKLDIPMTLGNNIIMLRPNEKEYNYFLYLWFKYFSGQGLIQGIKGGSAQPKFNKTDFKNLPLLIPSFEIIERSYWIFESMFSILSSNVKENSRLSTLRDTLLPRLMSGELEVPE